MVTRLAGELRIVVNASCKEEDLALLRALCPDLSFTLLEDALIALQGPAAEDALPAARSLAFMHAGTFQLARAECLVSRSGYTGEDGFEISVPRASAERLARELLANPTVKPVGLGARDTPRLEAGAHLYRPGTGAGPPGPQAGPGRAEPPPRPPGGEEGSGVPGADVYLRQQREGVSRRLVGR